ncbi:MAG: CBS domain-containing protein [Planctomycetes bacterium]|nr:CBS domain-containing protein [Planctomycetota bacterium]
MIVLYFMTPDPVVIGEDKNLLDLLAIYRERKLRRLPVVDTRGTLTGIVARSDLFHWVPPLLIAEPPSPELAEVLRSHAVRDVMTRNPVTCATYDHIENVCRRMIDAKVGAMPVLNRGHLVGIISETDLLRAMTAISYVDEEGKRISLRIPIEAKDDILYSVVDLARRSGLELLAVLTHPILDESALLVTLRVKGAGLDDFVTALWDAGYQGIDVD